jgi:hypothetical protein
MTFKKQSLHVVSDTRRCFLDKIKTKTAFLKTQLISRNNQFSCLLKHQSFYEGRSESNLRLIKKNTPS